MLRTKLGAALLLLSATLVFSSDAGCRSKRDETSRAPEPRIAESSRDLFETYGAEAMTEQSFDEQPPPTPDRTARSAVRVVKPTPKPAVEVHVEEPTPRETPFELPKAAQRTERPLPPLRMPPPPSRPEPPPALTLQTESLATTAALGVGFAGLWVGAVAASAGDGTNGDRVLALSGLGVGLAGLATAGVLMTLEPKNDQVKLSVAPGYLGVRGTF